MKNKMTWKPIDTVPNGLMRAILYWPKVALNEDLEQPENPEPIGGGLVAEGFRVGGTQWENDIITEHFENEAGFGYGDPTHWMPIPDPPASPLTRSRTAPEK